MLVLYNNVLQSLFRSQILTLGAVFFAILLMFWALFRSLSLALIAIAPNLLAAAAVLGVIGLVGIPLDIMTITIAAIVVGIGVDNCIRYVYRFKREFEKDRDYIATMYRCHGSIGRALYYTTLTVIIGFSTLTLSECNRAYITGLLTVLAMAAAVLGALLFASSPNYMVRAFRYIKDFQMKCRKKCGACCIAPSITTPFSGVPLGKPAGVKCVHLDSDMSCQLFGDFSTSSSMRKIYSEKYFVGILL